VESDAHLTAAAISAKLGGGRRAMKAQDAWPNGEDRHAVPNRAPDYPIKIAEWRRNNHQTVRITLDRFNNRETIDIRTWWPDDLGNWRPGRGGLTLAVKHLPALVQGLADALQCARALGLVEPEASAGGKDRTAAERQRRYRQRHNGASRGNGDVTA
jgi:Transcriptional Coactivator p15 (PC4)